VAVVKGPVINGEPHSVVVFLVCGRRATGEPRECKLVLDDEKIELKGGEEFITAFIPTKVLEPLS
jgi:hypothetical protein